MFSANEINDPLQVVEGEKLERLLCSLKDGCPRSASMYSTLRTYVDWHRRDPSVNYLILAPQGNCDDAACCLVLDREVCVRVMLFAHEPDVPRLIAAVKETSRVAWERVTQIARLPERMIGPVRIILEEKGCHLIVDVLNELVWLPPEEAMALADPIPYEGVRLRKLVEDDALRLVANWPHAAKDAVSLTKDTIRFNGGLGAENEKGELLGWVLWNHCGGIGQLFVYPAHRRKGVGRLLTITMSKEIAKHGHIVTANVVTKNDPSLVLLRSLNFRHGFFNVYIDVSHQKHGTPFLEDE